MLTARPTSEAVNPFGRSSGTAAFGLAVVAATAAACTLMFPMPTPLSGLEVVAASLRGEGPRSDFAADYVAARNMLHGTNPYPVLGPAFAEIGLDWPVEHRSPHPPTTALLAAPFTVFSWPHASATWTGLMIALLMVSVWAWGIPARVAVPLALATLLWPPAAWAVTGQLTPVWLAASALAWRWRRHAYVAGMVIGVAAMTKIVPLVLLAPFLLRRQIASLAGAATSIAGGVTAVIAIHPPILAAYFSDGRQASSYNIAREDNASLVAAAVHALGTPGGVLAFGAIAGACGIAISCTADGQLRRGEWALWNWIAVAALPIAWVYSLLPLLPGLLEQAKATRLSQRVTAKTAIALPWLTIPFGAMAAAVLPIAVGLAGAAGVLGLVRPSRERAAADDRPRMATMQ